MLFFVCLLALSIASFEVPVESFCLFYEFFLHSVYESSVRYMYCKYLFSLGGMSFHSQCNLHQKMSSIQMKSSQSFPLFFVPFVLCLRYLTIPQVIKILFSPKSFIFLSLSHSNL